jgi:hypothetical protein
MQKQRRRKTMRGGKNTPPATPEKSTKPTNSTPRNPDAEMGTPAPSSTIKRK